jgi:Fe2+ transport system protein B
MADRQENDHSDNATDSSLSRSAYRAQQRRAQDDFEKRDRERLRAETRYAKQHDTTDVAGTATEAKINRLKHRLNLAILGLSVGIVIVFLVLFFVEF